MKKTEDQLDKEYKWAMQVLMIINSYMMRTLGDPDSPYKNYADIAKYYADGKSEYEGGEKNYWQTIIDLQTMAEKELDSWEVIGDAANTCLDGPEDAKKWLLEEVLPPLIAEAEKRGWKKPASVAG
ncbi:MAG TPA: hypothetical protein PKC68_08955 [Alphaproteobacteria bacterium]|nr:hypothetical protein [Alphaproteobacteria bacterium]